MKIMLVALTFTVLLASGCGEEAPILGCNASNTIPAPADGLFTSFDGVMSVGVYAEVPAGPASAAPRFSTNGALHISLNTPVLSTAQVLLVDIPLPSCIDASAFTGLQFSLSGSISGCTFAQATQDSAHLHHDGLSNGPGTHGTGALGAHPNSTAVTADQITAAPQIVKMPFDAQTGGVPATPTDKSKLTWIDWVFAIDPGTPGGSTACIADLTIDDVRFY